MTIQAKKYLAFWLAFLLLLTIISLTCFSQTSGSYTPPAWKLTGNTGNTTNFIGTTDTNSLKFKVNSKEGMRMTQYGQLLVNTGNNPYGGNAFSSFTKLIVGDSSSRFNADPISYGGMLLYKTPNPLNLNKNGAGLKLEFYNPNVSSGADGGLLFKFYNGGNSTFNVWNEYRDTRSIMMSLDSTGILSLPINTGGIKFSDGSIQTTGVYSTPPLITNDADFVFDYSNFKNNCVVFNGFNPANLIHLPNESIIPNGLEITVKSNGVSDFSHTINIISDNSKNIDDSPTKIINTAYGAVTVKWSVELDKWIVVSSNQ